MILFSGNRNKVIVPASEVCEFMRRFPCSGLRERSYWFEFDPANGDLVDTDVPEQDDGAGSVALAKEAQEFWEQEHDAGRVTL